VIEITNVGEVVVCFFDNDRILLGRRTTMITQPRDVHEWRCASSWHSWRMPTPTSWLWLVRIHADRESEGFWPTDGNGRRRILALDRAGPGVPTQPYTK